MPFFLVATKIDLRIANASKTPLPTKRYGSFVSAADGQHAAASLGIPYYETSAFSRLNIAEPFVAARLLSCISKQRVRRCASAVRALLNLPASAILCFCCSQRVPCGGFLTLLALSGCRFRC